MRVHFDGSRVHKFDLQIPCSAWIRKIPMEYVGSSDDDDRMAAQWWQYSKRYAYLWEMQAQHTHIQRWLIRLLIFTLSLSTQIVSTATHHRKERAPIEVHKNLNIDRCFCNNCWDYRGNMLNISEDHMRVLAQVCGCCHAVTVKQYCHNHFECWWNKFEVCQQKDRKTSNKTSVYSNRKHFQFSSQQFVVIYSFLMLNNRIHDDDEFQSLCTMLKQKTKFFLCIKISVNVNVCVWNGAH